jgi:predicted metal-dependent hydrolase
LQSQCKEQFGKIIEEIYPVFKKYVVAQPSLRIRDMDTRWGSCLPKKEIITLNKRLLGAPRHCIEYEITHEFCHFICSNHSKRFFELLTMLMPDWKERKKALDYEIIYKL